MLQFLEGINASTTFGVAFIRNKITMGIGMLLTVGILLLYVNVRSSANQICLLLLL